MGQLEDPRGALVRPYAMTRGRTVPSQDIAIEAVLVITDAGHQEGRFAGYDKGRISSMCEQQPLSLAEIAAYTRMPLGVARVIVADMVVEGLLSLHSPAQSDGFEDQMDMLERVLSGLRRL